MLASILHSKFILQLSNILFSPNTMKSKMKSWVVLVFGLMILILNATASPLNLITCQEAFDQVAIPCKPFLQRTSVTSPSQTCCEGAKLIMKQDNTPELRKGLCFCLRSIAIYLDFDPDRAKQLSPLCKLDVPIPIDPNEGCNL